MKKVKFYSPPFGDEIENPDTRLLEIMILYVDGNFWASGSGQAWITYVDDKKYAKLILTFDISNTKFCLEYDSNQEPRCVSLGEGDFNHIISTYVGGDKWILPTKFFVSPTETWLAIEEFCNTGNKTDKITWGKRSEINWHYGYTET
jgi:hypothetical protein